MAGGACQVRRKAPAAHSFVAFLQNLAAPEISMLIQPIRVCHLVGHKRTGYDPDGHPDNYRERGRRRWYSRCDRCGTTDCEEVYREGALERFTWWRMRLAWHRATSGFRFWLRTDCTDCSKPMRQFGRPVGNHTKCDDIPF